jgi:glutamate carboxypeptidase
MRNAATSYFDAASPLDEIRSWVETESPTTEPAAVNRMVDKVEADARALIV